LLDLPGLATDTLRIQLAFPELEHAVMPNSVKLSLGIQRATQPSCSSQSWGSGQGWQRTWWIPDGTASPISASDDALSRTAEQARVEAILFLAREPLTSRKIAQFGNLPDGTAARTVMRQLNQLYDAAGTAFRIEELGGGYQLLTRQMFGTWLKQLLPQTLDSSGSRLSAPALETLAVVAYRQPILRAEIETVRGVQCGDLLRQLLERDLIRISGRSQDLGRPLLYGTTKRFLQLFGLRHLDELPRAEQLRMRPVQNELLVPDSCQQDSRFPEEELT
jgi:segregation and condensation protein B